MCNSFLVFFSLFARFYVITLNYASAINCSAEPCQFAFSSISKIELMGKILSLLIIINNNYNNSEWHVISE